MRGFPSALASGALALLAACSAMADRPPPSPDGEVPRFFSAGASPDVVMPLVVDTDMGLDDWSALLYVLAHPRVAVKAITVSGAGEATCDLDAGLPLGAENARRLMRLAGKDDPDVVVACGRGRPLSGDRAFPTPWRADADGMLESNLPASGNAPSDRRAVDVLQQQLRASPTPVTILALGPLTNLGELLTEYPDITAKIAAIYVMGGALDVPGNVDVSGGSSVGSDRAEWNLYVDPAAAGVVFRSGAPVKLVPLDAAVQVPVTLTFRDRLEKDRSTPSADFVFRYFARSTRLPSGTYRFADALAAAVLTRPDLCTFVAERVDVVTTQTLDRGRALRAGSAGVSSVCARVDRPAFEDTFLAVLNGRGPG